jgi:hypothetical protein
MISNAGRQRSQRSFSSCNKATESLQAFAEDQSEIHLQPTASESSMDESSIYIDSSFESESEDSGHLRFIPTGLFSPSRQTTSLPPVPVKNDEDRLLMLAKHPNATEIQVRHALYMKQHAKLARELKQRVAADEIPSVEVPQPQQVRFSSSSPVDADTGKAWNRQSTTKTKISNEGNCNASFDRAWGDDVENPQPLSPTAKKSTFLGWWNRILPIHSHHTSSSNASDSFVSPQDMSVSITSDKTPTISNVDHAARSKRIRRQMGYSTTSDNRCDQVMHKVVHTRQGRVVLLLSLILIVAIIWTVVEAFGTGSKDDSMVHSNHDSGTDTQQPYFPDFPTSSPVDTSAPTIIDPAEAAAPNTVAVPTTPNPTGTPTSGRGTLAPTVRVTTQNPSFAPFLQPSARPTLPPTQSPGATPTQTPVPETTSSPEATFLASPQLTTSGLPIVGSEPGQRFGHAVALSQDGIIMAIGAPFATNESLEEAGMVQVFEWVNDNWQPRGLPIMGRNARDQLGSDVALSNDGSVLVVSEPAFRGPAGASSGNVRTFVYDGKGYSQVGGDLPGLAATDHFGFSISLSADGKRLAVGAPYHNNGGSTRNVSGNVVVYDFQAADGSWLPIATMAGTAHLDWFGHMVDLTEDGSILCVGAPRNVEFGGYVRCYNLNTGESMGGILSNDNNEGRYDDSFGHALKIEAKSGGDAVRLAIGAPGRNRAVLDAGIVMVYEYEAGKNEWKEVGEPIVADTPEAEDEFGFSLDFRDGILVVGSPGRAQVDRFVFIDDERSTEWRRHASLQTGMADSSYGYSLVQRGNRLVVGSPETPGENSGMVNAYEP